MTILYFSKEPRDRHFINCAHGVIFTIFSLKILCAKQGKNSDSLRVRADLLFFKSQITVPDI